MMRLQMGAFQLDLGSKCRSNYDGCWLGRGVELSACAPQEGLAVGLGSWNNVKPIRE